MAFKAYEDACSRAELFGQPLPHKEEFLEKNKHLDVVEFDEIEIRTTENTAMLDENLKQGTSGLTELNTILNSTQSKLNKFKGVCGSLTNFFRVKLSTKDNLSYSSEPSYVGQTNYDKDYIPPKKGIGSVNEGLGPNDNEMVMRAGKSQNGGDINTALKDLETMQKKEDATVVKDVGKMVTSQVSRLDQMIHQADRAQTTLHHQNKQMRGMLRLNWDKIDRAVRSSIDPNLVIVRTVFDLIPYPYHSIDLTPIGPWYEDNTFLYTI